MKNQNQKLLPIFLAKTPATSCGINIKHKRSSSGIRFYLLHKYISLRLIREDLDTKKAPYGAFLDNFNLP